MPYSPKDFAADILSGVHDAWVAAFNFSEEEAVLVWPEYLVTVSLAHRFYKLADENRTLPWKKLGLEEATESLARRALLPRPTKKVCLSRPGRVDLALFEKQGGCRPIFIIEVKDAVIQYGEAVNDVRRNEEFLLLKREDGTFSSINMAAVVMLIRKKNTRILQNVLVSSAAGTAANIQSKLAANLDHPDLISVHWEVRPVSDTARPDDLSEDDWDEYGGPTVRGDEQYTMAMVGVFYRKGEHLEFEESLEPRTEASGASTVTAPALPPAAQPAPPTAPSPAAPPSAVAPSSAPANEPPKP